MPENYPLRRWPRKWWEWDYTADCAEQLVVLASTTTAAGLGAGDEPLIFYLADKCRRVIASDLYSPNTVWREARFANTSRILDASPIPYPRSRVALLNADMRQTGISEQSIDFVWSCSSTGPSGTTLLVHGCAASVLRRAIRPSCRGRPGGCAAHAAALVLLRWAPPSKGPAPAGSSET